MRMRMTTHVGVPASSTRIVQGDAPAMMRMRMKVQGDALAMMRMRMKVQGDAPAMMRMRMKIEGGDLSSKI
jgi:hypothetical protein